MHSIGAIPGCAALAVAEQPSDRVQPDTIHDSLGRPCSALVQRAHDLEALDRPVGQNHLVVPGGPELGVQGTHQQTVLLIEEHPSIRPLGEQPGPVGHRALDLHDDRADKRYY